MIHKLRALNMFWMLAVVMFGIGSARSMSEDQRRFRHSRLAAPSNCSQLCDTRTCPPIPQCKQALVKDRCNCCLTCPRQPPHPGFPLRPCAGVTCYDRKICIINMQGLPLCKCPSDEICANAPREPTCGSDRVLYYSKCLKRVQECRKGKKITDVPRRECTMRQQKKGKIQPMRTGEDKELRKPKREARKLSRRHRKKVLDMTRASLGQGQAEVEEGKMKTKNRRNRRRNKNKKPSKRQLLRRLRKAKRLLKRYQKRVRAAKSRQRRKAINVAA